MVDVAPLDGADPVESVEALAKELETTVNRRSNTFSTGIGMADILAHLHVDEDTLSAAVLYRSVREGLIPLQDIQELFGEQVFGLVKGTLAMGRLSDLIEKNKRLEDHFNNNQREHLNGIYKMLISVTEDVRVVLIKLAEMDKLWEQAKQHLKLERKSNEFAATQQQS
jgi:GTP pyrophosphokinase